MPKLDFPPVGIIWKSGGIVLATCTQFKITRSVNKSLRIAKQFDVNIRSLKLVKSVIEAQSSSGSMGGGVWKRGEEQARVISP
ncbi:hypothetical protein TNCV_1741611 [Trichonephila clavipes]|uniref:Uncharacterized protein n=1 Tax=Trichonephila clavipes TaxID=2585209 RepID=A0A8X6RII6_TRICX|nr:hypothetical protein TNCV_1741611 [Trichonephila clavipes]